MTTESEWIRLAIQGDQDAFGRLVTVYQTPVYNLTYRMLGNAAEAEDAAQETFLRAYAHLRRYDPARSFKTWLLSIASHYCIDRLRRRRINWLELEDEIAEAESLAPNSPNPVGVVIQREHEESMQVLLAQLSPTDRAAVSLRYWYDYSYEEIANTLNLTVSAVKSRLHRSRKQMAKMLVAEENSRISTISEAFMRPLRGSCPPLIFFCIPQRELRCFRIPVVWASDASCSLRLAARRSCRSPLFSRGSCPSRRGGPGRG